MTTLVPLLLGCSGFALGLPGSLGVVELVALEDILVHWDGSPLVVDFVCCWSATEECSWSVGLAPLLLSVCTASAYLCPMRRWCVEVVCTGGFGGACLRVFQFMVYAGCTRGFVDGGWSLRTRMFFGVVGVTALGWAVWTWNILVLDTYLYIFFFHFLLIFMRVCCNLGF